MSARCSAACLLFLLACPLRGEEPVAMPPPDVPGAIATWTPGHWLWTGSQWSWIPGSWQIARPSATAPGPHWVEGQWMPGANGMVWVPGHYEGGAGAGAGGAQVVVEVAAPAPMAAAPAPVEVVDQPAYVVERPLCSTVVVAGPVCPAPPLCLGMRAGGAPRCLPVPVPPLPSLRPLAAIAHHAFGLGRLPFPDPLFFLHHR